MAEYKASDLIPAPAERCHVCGKPLRYSKRAMKERCVNPDCQVYRIYFNILLLPKEGKMNVE